jgi:hypothetical protein
MNCMPKFGFEELFSNILKVSLIFHYYYYYYFVILSYLHFCVTSMIGHYINSSDQSAFEAFFPNVLKVGLFLVVYYCFIKP